MVRIEELQLHSQECDVFGGLANNKFESHLVK